MWQYYAQYWQRWQREHPQEWHNLHSHLLNTLAAAGEPLPPGQLATLAGLADVAAVDFLLSVEWRPFVHQVPDSDGFRYGIFHASFREFMEGQVDTGSLRSAERAVAHQMAMATRAAHAAIADRYLTAWGGLQTLAGLRDPELSRMDDKYGLRHLAKHLVGARRDEDLHRLLWVGWTSETVPEAPGGHVVNAWREAHERVAMLSEYLGDLQHAWLLAEAAAAADVKSQRVSPAIPLMLRYALLTASVNSLAANLPPNLLRELVQRDRLPLAEALAYARRGPDPLGRSEALLALGTDLEEPEAVRDPAGGAGRSTGDRRRAVAYRCADPNRALPAGVRPHGSDGGREDDPRRVLEPGGDGGRRGVSRHWYPRSWTASRTGIPATTAGTSQSSRCRMPWRWPRRSNADRGRCSRV